MILGKGATQSVKENEYVMVQVVDRLLLTTLINQYPPGTTFKMFLNDIAVPRYIAIEPWRKVKFLTPKEWRGHSRKEWIRRRRNSILETNVESPYSLGRETEEPSFPTYEVLPEERLPLPVNPMPYNK